MYFNMLFCTTFVSLLSCTSGKYPPVFIISTSAPIAKAPPLNALSTFVSTSLIASSVLALIYMSITTLSGTEFTPAPPSVIT